MTTTTSKTLIGVGLLVTVGVQLTACSSSSTGSTTPFVAAPQHPPMSVVQVKLCISELAAQPDAKGNHCVDTLEHKYFFWGKPEQIQAKVLVTDNLFPSQPVGYGVFAKSQGCFPIYTSPQAEGWFNVNFPTSARRTRKVDVTYSATQIEDKFVDGLIKGTIPADGTPVFLTCPSVDIAKVEAIGARGH